MMQPAITLAGTRVKPGQQTTLSVPVARLYPHTEMAMPVHVVHGRREGPRLFVSGALLDISSDDDPYEGKSREYEESAPDKSLSILTMHDFNEKYSGSVGFYYVGDMSWMDANPNIPGIRNTGVYRILDMRLVRNFKFGDERLSTAIVLKNLLDDYSDYDAIQNTPEPVVVQNLVAYIELKLKIQ